MAHDIAEWLDGLGLGQYAQAFADSEIDFDVLSKLSDDDLKELGLTLGARRRLGTAIEALSSEEHRTQPVSPPARGTELHPTEAERQSYRASGAWSVRLTFGIFKASARRNDRRLDIQKSDVRDQSLGCHLKRSSAYLRDVGTDGFFRQRRHRRV